MRDMFLDEGKQIVNRLKEKGLKAVVVGGIYKGKEEVHDIDLITRQSNGEKDLKILREQNLDCPVELYITSDKQYKRLRDALRSTTYENITGHKMRGLRYNKVRIE